MNDSDTMQAGRELDALVHEEVLEHSPFDCYDMDYMRVGPDGDEIPVRSGGVLDDVPAYSTDMAAAMQVVEAMKARGLRLSLDAFGGDPWWCEFADETWTYGAQAEAEAAPLAICRAALTAVQP